MAVPSIDEDLKAVVREILLQRIHIAARTSMPHEVLRSLDIRMVDQLAGHVEVMVTTFIHGLPDRSFVVQEAWPATWWDAFKVRWFPRWALRRWPCVWACIDVEEKAYKAVFTNLRDPDAKEFFKVHLA